MRPVESKPDHDVAYLTDVEGSWTRLQSFCARSPLVTLEGEVLRVRDGATFVFGGDAIDRGPWSRKIVRTLLAAREAQPNGVVLLGGNRDLNKLRLARELAGHPPKRAPDEAKAWPPGQLLKWILAHTMGAPDAFAHRRAELAAERTRDPSTIEDDDVAQSFVDDLRDDGDLARYLGACQLTWRAGHTLFVHGGVAEEALAVVPGHPVTDLANFDDAVWRARLDDFYAGQMAAFRARAIEADGRPAWESAILYQAPRAGLKLNPGSVVYGRMGDDQNNPALPSRATIDALQRCGIRRVVVGHTPSGDTPSIVRAAATAQPFEVLVCDNSRSRVETASVVTLRDEMSRIEGRCVLDDGSTTEVDLILPLDDRATPIGRRVRATRELVKGGGEGAWLLFRYDPGWQVLQRLAPTIDEVEDAASGTGA